MNSVYKTNLNLQNLDKSDIGFVRAMAREMMVHRTDLSVDQAIDLSASLVNKTSKFSHAHGGYHVSERE
jgi:hypothetical protein